MSEENESKPQPDEAEEYESTEEEFRAIFEEVDEVERQMMQLAAKMQPSAPQMAEALRQTAGNLCPLLSKLTAATGAALQTVEDVLESEDEETEESEEPALGEEDALMFGRTFVANMNLVKKLLESATTEEEREVLSALLKLNEEALSRTAELAEVDQEELVTEVTQSAEQRLDS
jgi:2,4-dienoyl-CoA reductase-like NADH-dependent reductase (Old Yellow Enzyme family)